MASLRMIGVSAVFSVVLLGCQYRNEPENGKQACALATETKRCPTGYECLMDGNGVELCFVKGSGSQMGGQSGGQGAGGTGGSTLTIDGGVDGPPSVKICEAGTHLCGDDCVSNTESLTCGKSCRACEAPVNGKATCDGTACGGSCDTGKKLCAGRCINEAEACDATCATGRHDCKGLCADDTDVNSCGKLCAPCTVPANADATCKGGACGFDCKPQQHVCGTACKADIDANACGADCKKCPTDPNGSAVCSAGNCALECKDGFHLCGTICVSNKSLETCGASSCKACNVPTGGSATCDGVSCAPACPSGKKICQGICVDESASCGQGCASGSHDCSGFCVPNNATANCGLTSCAACPLPQGASATTCNSISCDFDCASGYHRCGKVCNTDSDAGACGTGCINCPIDPNGNRSCVGGNCRIDCINGFHKCDGVCVANTSLNSCGSSSCDACTAPTGGTVSCDGTRCVPACPGMQLCNGVCIANNISCDGKCPSGQHDCSGICRSNASVDSCGVSACGSCAKPQSNGDSTCNVNTGCGIACNQGYRQCGTSPVCVGNAHPSCCSASECTQGGAFTTATCNSNACSYPCANGYKNCNGQCIANGVCCSSADCTFNGTGICLGNGRCDYQVLIDADQNVSGSVTTAGGVFSNTFTVGEAPATVGTTGWRVLFAFSRSSVPANAIVTSAWVNAYQNACSNDPYNNGNGTMYVTHVGYGTALSAAWFNGTIGNSPYEKDFANSPEVGWRSQNVTEWTQFDMANGINGGLYWEHRLGFAQPYYDDAVIRRCTFTTATSNSKPYMSLEIELPAP
ncbi:MAG: hypothetical protein SGI86_12770 [Deltaproteobacteria bacterium]|nr:hypothetical protein [Deltaproteobacteria bacterium]